MAPKIPRNPYQNQILSGLDAFDLQVISPHLTLVKLAAKQRLELAGREVEVAYFIESGVASVVATSRISKKQAEVGLIGFEGMTGLALVAGTTQSPHETVMQTDGTAHSIDAKWLRQLMDRSPTMLARFALYGISFHVQTGQALLANATGSVEQRLARWLLMAHDRLKAPGLPLTHESLSFMLGVRRPGVTIALQRLEALGLIEAARGVITLTDRKKTLAFAGEFYGVPEAEYKRLFRLDPKMNPRQDDE